MSTVFFDDVVLTTPKSMAIALSSLILVGCANQPTYRAGFSQQPKKIPSRYQVQRGDTVSKIASRYGLNWREISKINNLDSKHTIRVGQWLILHSKNQTLPHPNKALMNHTSRSYNDSFRVSATRTNTPIPTNQGVVISKTNQRPHFLSFDYPIDRTYSIARHFGTPVNLHGQPTQTEGTWFLGKPNDSVRAAQSGQIVSITSTPTGDFLDILHENGFTTSYFHITNVSVKQGQKVNKGDHIARIKQQNNGVALLEFRVTHDGKYINPITVLE